MVRSARRARLEPWPRSILRDAALRAAPQDEAAHSAVQPPSMTSEGPVISAEASLAKNTIAPIRSSTGPRRPSLILSSTAFLKVGFWKDGMVIGVSMKVGASELTRMPFGATSQASALVKPSTACLAEQ